jgi:hypothetical protein
VRASGGGPAAYAARATGGVKVHRGGQGRGCDVALEAGPRRPRAGRPRALHHLPRCAVPGRGAAPGALPRCGRSARGGPGAAGGSRGAGAEGAIARALTQCAGLAVWAMGHVLGCGPEHGAGRLTASVNRRGPLWRQPAGLAPASCWGPHLQQQQARLPLHHGHHICRGEGLRQRHEAADEVRGAGAQEPGLTGDLHGGRGRGV